MTIVQRVRDIIVGLVMLALALLALCRIHISDGIDTLLLKVHLLKKTKQKDL